MTWPRHTNTVKLPAGPLARLVDAAGGINTVISGRGIPYGSIERKHWEKAYARAHRSGAVSLYVADQIACRLLGIHPSLVWGDAWWRASADSADSADSAGDAGDAGDADDDWTAA